MAETSSEPQPQSQSQPQPQPQPPTSPAHSTGDGGSSRRSSTASATASAAAAAAAAGCDIESVGPNGEITWRRMSMKKKFNACSEFPEFGRRGVARLHEAFDEFDADRDGHLGLEDLKLMMECLKAPQTHLGLKALLREFSPEGDAGRLDFRGFLGLFRKAAAGQLAASDTLLAWYAEYVGVGEVSVGDVGVRGAKEFFEAKIAIHGAGDLVQAEIREEQRRKQAEEEARRVRQENFRAKRDLFKQ